MNNVTISDFQVILPTILIGISLVFLAFRKRNLFGFFFMGAILVALFLIMDIVHIRKQNKKIAGVYRYNWGDPLAVEKWNGVMVPDSCRIILSKNQEFKIENCPLFITDSSGYWNWKTNGNYFGVDFFDKNKKDINAFSQVIPYDEIRIGLEPGVALFFIKAQ